MPAHIFFLNDHCQILWQVLMLLGFELALAKEFGNDRLELICERALILNIHSYKALRSMLVNDADLLPFPVLGTVQSHLPQHHENVRGAEHFG